MKDLCACLVSYLLGMGASQLAAGHSLSFIIIIVFMTLGWGL